LGKKNQKTLVGFWGWVGDGYGMAMKIIYPTWEKKDKDGGMRCAFPPYEWYAC
jgi:hypothetical protein